MNTKPALLALPLQLLPLFATAQSAPAPEAPAAEAPAQSVQLEAVVVTGANTYRASDAAVGVLGEQKLLDTPFSITVLSQVLLQNQQAATYGDYLKNDPSATVGNVPVGFTQLRGFSVGTDGYLYDGLTGYLGLSDGRNQIKNVAGVEVLKGPSAFLFGLGGGASPGGAFNFVPKRPLSGPVREVAANYTSDSLFGTTVDVGDRFGSQRQFGWRFNGGYRDGEQAVDGADWQHRTAAASLDWRASADLLLTGIFEYANNRFPRLQPFLVLAPGIAVPRAPDASRNVAQPWDDFHVESANSYLRADWQLADGISLTVQGLHSQSRREATQNARFGFVNSEAGDVTLFGSLSGSAGQASSGQALLRAKAETWGIGHQITVGLSGSTGSSRFNNDGALGVFATNLYEPVAYAEPDAVPATIGLAQRNRATGVIVSDLLSFTPQWSLLLGARNSSLKVKSYDPATEQLLPPEQSLTRTTPTAALLYKPVPAVSLYTSYGENLESGGIAPQGSVNEDEQLAPIRAEQIEAGAKWERGGLGLTAAVFQLQRPFEYVDSGSGRYVQNGEQRHRGIELGATGELLPGLALVTGAAFIDPKTKDTGNPGTEGKRALGVSRVKANAFADYRLPWVAGLFVNGGVYYASRQFVDGENTQAIGGWTRYDLGTRYETRLAGTRTALLLGVENLTDRDYWASAQSGILTLAEPRTVKATIHAEF